MKKRNEKIILGFFLVMLVLAFIFTMYLTWTTVKDINNCLCLSLMIGCLYGIGFGLLLYE